MSSKILAVDTATENCSVALISGSEVIARCAFAPREHTTKILPMVDEVLAEAGYRLGELDALAFGRGPGSFTGVRIGIGIAQGLAFGADLPMIGVSTLAAMAQGTYRHHQAEHVLAAIDARMGEIYWGQYQRQVNGDWKVLGDEAVFPPELAADRLIAVPEARWLTAGTGWKSYEEQLAVLAVEKQVSTVLYPEAQDMAWLAQFALQRGETVDAEHASPVYLRDEVTWKKLPGRE
ncbi:tRNA (adenosine(37)-N6)-threonylcarbamoyltransferase complex dimerization subunit type 1 TsaB [Photobacterium sp. 1_MG-2023]|uniref:tRNA (adenosine(37)-N6)-threonylcarbamoyltransferase complex dimerization subunit type 1 TsaB n=1 Tax=Photobacterium sp. 1_MG-2023 TaxID=3062646 RepID=UPI0026E3F922|nr:tRNA (adenosine(37)-N6)-threonylcarbamoyltransferase complex dimerization subunit type 1 TsaB [Photobacterium sp. 1_MG-2023]MDO6705723.1 tRNA (adenosine(37)-N6)-threonylcarbamoyltransferase complex dimerization subunit type 1 TsaB [Photobacterium sp. 1_MG-2023]